MKLNSSLLVCALLAAGLSHSTWAANQPNDPNPTPLGAQKPNTPFTEIRIKNLQDESLGRIKDLAIDLVNGRIVEVLVTTDGSLDEKGKVVAVPPLALIPDPLNEVYRLDVSTEVFKSAPGINLSKWTDAGESRRVAATYKLFGQEPYFTEEGATVSTTASRSKVALGYVERSIKIQDMPVGNLQDQKFGNVWTLTFDISKGRILSVIVLAPGNFKTKSVIPAMALSFNAKRDGLLLDDTKTEFAEEPRYVFTDAAFGHAGYSKEEAYTGPHTDVALEQGNSYRDLDLTVMINRDIRLAKISGRNNVQVGASNGRVTLRGWVLSADDKRRIGEIAIQNSRLELVDNQIVIGKPTTAN